MSVREAGALDVHEAAVVPTLLRVVRMRAVLFGASCATLLIAAVVIYSVRAGETLVARAMKVGGL